MNNDDYIEYLRNDVSRLERETRSLDYKIDELNDKIENLENKLLKERDRLDTVISLLMQTINTGNRMKDFKHIEKLKGILDNV